MKETLVYLAGPITLGDTILNVKHALGIAETLIDQGYTPIVPHLSIWWHFLHPHDHDWWIEYDLVILKRCDCLLRLPGKSAGADQEVDFCLEQGIPVFYNIDALNKWREQREGE